MSIKTQLGNTTNQAEVASFSNLRSFSTVASTAFTNTAAALFEKGAQSGTKDDKRSFIGVHNQVSFAERVIATSKIEGGYKIDFYVDGGGEANQGKALGGARPDRSLIVTKNYVEEVDSSGSARRLSADEAAKKISELRKILTDPKWQAIKAWG